jgi:hypothetical protein
LRPKLRHAAIWIRQRKCDDSFEFTGGCHGQVEDGRAGAISEATAAGAELEHVKHAATHSNICTTQRYSRQGEEKIANVQQLRVEGRKNKTRTDTP